MVQSTTEDLWEVGGGGARQPELDIARANSSIRQLIKEHDSYHSAGLHRHLEIALYLILDIDIVSRRLLICADLPRTSFQGWRQMQEICE